MVRDTKLLLRPKLRLALPLHTQVQESLLTRSWASLVIPGMTPVLLITVSAILGPLALENYRKYGFLFTFAASDPGTRHDMPFFILSLAYLPFAAAIAWIIELITEKGYLGPFRFPLLTANIISVFTLATIMSWHVFQSPFSSVLILGVYVAVVMKLISYHAVNSELLSLRPSQRKALYPECPFPQNLTFSNIRYFFFAPTLCYQPTYPRSPRIRPIRLLTYILYLMSYVFIMRVIAIQYILPTLRSTFAEHGRVTLSRLLKLSISSTLGWLAMFLAIFHALLNVISELMRFGDRKFYEEWWNAKTLAQFWRLWNVPVHSWFKRHIAEPLARAGYSNPFTLSVIFFLSAVGHEFLFSIPLKGLYGYAFVGFLLQIPLYIATEAFHQKYPNSQAGNFFFWVLFCLLGQPLMLLAYFRVWQTTCLSK